MVFIIFRFIFNQTGIGLLQNQSEIDKYSPISTDLSLVRSEFLCVEIFYKEKKI